MDSALWSGSLEESLQRQLDVRLVEASIIGLLQCRGPLTPGRIIQVSRIHRGAVYDALPRLQERELIAADEGRSPRSYGVRLDVVNALLVAREKEIVSLRRRFQLLQ